MWYHRLCSCSCRYYHFERKIKIYQYNIYMYYLFLNGVDVYWNILIKYRQSGIQVKGKQVRWQVKPFKHVNAKKHQIKIPKHKTNRALIIKLRVHKIRTIISLTVAIWFRNYFLHSLLKNFFILENIDFLHLNQC